MDEITVRYGATLDIEVETEDLTSETVTMFVGKAGETPVITLTANFVDGVATLSADSEDTKVPLGKYKYQLTVTAAEGKIYKYPTEDDCDDCDPVDLPTFTVLEALDETEVVS